MFGIFFENRRLRKQLEKYVSQEGAGVILQGGPAPATSLKTGSIDFVLAFVRGDTSEQIAERMLMVSDLAVEQDAIVHCHLAGLVAVAFGTHSSSTPPSPAARQSLVTLIKSRLGKDVKMLYGSTPGYWGNIGTRLSAAYTFIIPKFDAALAQLGKAEFGSIEEWKE